MKLSILMVGAVKPGYASRNKLCLRCLLKSGNVNAAEIWVGSLFQTWDAVDEKDFAVALMFSSMIQIWSWKRKKSHDIT